MINSVIQWKKKEKKNTYGLLINLSDVLGCQENNKKEHLEIKKISKNNRVKQKLVCLKFTYFSKNVNFPESKVKETGKIIF